MENVVLFIQLILAAALIVVVLMQRSEGGGLGIGGGGGGGGMMSGRSAATALSKLTWIIAVLFLTATLVLTILAARSTQSDSVIERLGTGQEGEIELPPLPPALEGDLTAPVPSDGPALPPKAE